MSLAFERRAERGMSDRPIPLLRVVLLVLTVLVIHGLLFRRLRLAGVGPELFVALALLAGLDLGVAGGAATGVLAGLAADFCTTTAVGLWALVGGLLGLTTGLIRERAYSDSLRRPPFAIVAIGTLFALPLERALAFVVDEAPFPSPTRFAWILLVAPLWAVVITVPVRLLVRAVMGLRS